MKFLFLAILFWGSQAFGETSSNQDVLDQVWAIGKTNACSPAVRARFDETTLSSFKSQVNESSDREQLARILNPFLFSLGYSHTEFFTDKMESYYVFKGYYSESHPEAPPAPRLVNPGVQVGSDDHGFFVREVLDGFPASKVGLAKGDRLFSIDGVPFNGFWGDQAKSGAAIRILHDGAFKELHVALPALEWSQAFQDATLNSIHVINFKNLKIGYVHLWSGIHPDSATALWSAVKKLAAQNIDGLVLDLRGGYGGAFYEHLDPFFPDRSNYFSMSATDGENNMSVVRADPQTNKGAYLGPMVVLIDEGSRSGKEAMAFQFKKSKRAKLVGHTTAGYYAGGGLFFADATTDFLLYLCVMRDATLDGTVIEGIGISPDFAVPFATDNAFRDSQLQKALEQF